MSKKNALFHLVKAEKRATQERELLYVFLNNPKAYAVRKLSEYQWVGNGSELLELMLALFSSGRIQNKDNSKIKFTSFANDFQHFCNFKIADTKGRKVKLMMRKKNQVPFLTELMRSFNEQVNHYFE